MTLRLEEVAGAFGLLTEGNPGPLVDLLDPEVVWVEHLGSRPSRSLIGRVAVRELLTSRLGGCRPALIGLMKIEGFGLALTYTRPWWVTRHPMRARLVCVFLGDAVQMVTVDAAVSRVASYAGYMPSGREHASA